MILHVIQSATGDFSRCSGGVDIVPAFAVMLTAKFTKAKSLLCHHRLTPTNLIRY